MRAVYAAYFAGVLFTAMAMTAQAPPYIYDGHAEMDESCHVTLKPQPGDDPKKPRTKKNSAMCQRTKDKNVYVDQALMWKGVPKTMNVHIREMTYLLQNPTSEKVRYIFTYRLHPGHRIDLGGGPKPVSESESEAVYIVDVNPGTGVKLDVSDRDK